MATSIVAWPPAYPDHLLFSLSHFEKDCRLMVCRKQSRAWRTGFLRIAAMTRGESIGQTPCPSIAAMDQVEHCTQVTPDPHRMDQAGVPGAMVVPGLRGRCGWPARQLIETTIVHSRYRQWRTSFAGQ